MPPLPRNVRQEQVIRALIRAGGIESRRLGKGSHKRVTMPSGVKVTIPSGILKPGTLSSVIKQAGLSVEEFLDLL